MARAVLPVMRKQGEGRIINIGSAAGSVTMPGMGFYSASKGALARYTEALWGEVEPLGIKVSLVEPGFLRTSFYSSAKRTTNRIPDYDAVRTTLSRRLKREFGKGGDPEKVAQTVVKIVRANSPHLRYLVGARPFWLPFARAVTPDSMFLSVYRRWFSGNDS
jgi:short-subunit dehydrogenase